MENIGHDEKTSQSEDDDVAHDVTVNDDVACGMAMYLEA